jgi:Ca2+-binding RTX toxin-like protein
MHHHTISVPGGGSFKLKVFGNATVKAGSGNDTVNITGNGKIIIGNGNDVLTIGKHGNVQAGNGNDSITVHRGGAITVGGGNDTISLYGHHGSIHQLGAGGHDTINLGSGNDTIFEQGSASVYGSFGSATVVGGELKFSSHHGVGVESAVDGSATLMGGTGRNEFIGGSGTTVMNGGHGNDTFVGGSGHDTMMGGSSHNIFEFLHSGAGGQHVISNFVHGMDKLYLEGHSLSYLQSHGDITHSGGNTFIHLDGGATQIELTGVNSLSASDVTTHKN